MVSTIAYAILSLLLPVLALAQDPENGPVANPAPIPTVGSSPNSEAGASGGNQGAYSLSRGGLIAIIVVVVVFALLGIGSAVLFYVAKKRQWELRKSIKRVSRKVVSRRNSVKSLDRQSRRHGTVRLASETKASRPRDLEKGDTRRAPEAKKTPDTRDVSDAKEKKWKAILPDSWSVGDNRNGSSQAVKNTSA
ncbi:MAG: hypothetical protein M1828_000671 [Chrysothrix sp. TS-e1954]|nr:MAG: hypothetical protein M1828_000671 [Chrysothrix sp. TS-e1954]